MGHASKCATIFFLWALIASCGDGELNPLLSDAGSDSDTDVDSDTDSDVDSDSDGDTDTDPGCPLDSGYPCACSPQIGACNDGSDCITVGPSSLGMCSHPCGPGDPACQDTQGYGVNGWCGFDANGPAESNEFNHCIVTCRFKTDTGPCPPGLVCVPHMAVGIPPQEICVPSF